MSRLRLTLSFCSLVGVISLWPSTMHAQSLTVSTTGLSFGTVPVQQTSGVRSIQLSNNSDKAVQIQAIVTSGNFSQTNNCPSILNPLSHCQLNVIFSPGNTLGPITGALSVANSGIGSLKVVNLVVSLSGTSVLHMMVGGYNPQPIVFGLYQNTVVANNLTSPIQISASTSGPFTQQSNCPSSLPPGGRCSVSLSVVTNVAGYVSGALIVNNMTEGSSFIWPLTAFSNGKVTPSLSFNPTVLYFWNQLVGSTSIPQSISVSNGGSNAVTLNPITVAGPFSLSNDTCSRKTLSPGDNCSIAVAFTPNLAGNTPGVAGYNNGALTVSSTDPASPQTINLFGSAIYQPGLSPGSVTVTPQPVGVIGEAHTITLTNYRSTPLHISSITASSGYAETTNCPKTLNAYSNCTIQLRFTPAAPGPITGAVTVVHDAANSPLVANLFGLGLKSSSMNTTQIENAKPGDGSWVLTAKATNHEIEGYASATSVNRGDTIQFYVNTSAPSYKMDIYRMGWYGGLGARRMLPTIQLPGVQQPTPITDPVTRLTQCPWSSTYSLTIGYSQNDPTIWASGIYLVKLTEAIQGKQSYMIVVVRDDDRKSDLLFQSSTNTYQAYNSWGRYSLYSVPQAYKVSFDRPYNTGSGAGLFTQWGWENSILRFLEREGYDVTYATDTDSHTSPGLLLGHKGLIDAGHDEYWSWEMRDNWEASRDAGVNLAFLGSDDSSWQVRYEPNTLTQVPNRTLTCYKNAKLDPYFNDGNPDHQKRVTVRFSDYPVDRPEATMIGVMYIFQTFGEYDMVVANSPSWIFANTGLQNGDHLAGLLGYEADSLASSSPSNVLDLAHSPFQVAGYELSSDMTLYTAASGSNVVATGSMHWAWALDDLNTAENPEPAISNPAVQQMLRNVLATFGATAP